MKEFKPNANREEVKLRFDLEPDQDPCIYCGRPVRLNATTQWIHLVNGGDQLAKPGATVEPMGDCGLFPVGPECAKKAGKAYLHSLPERVKGPLL